jgi:hypothetical protein
MCFCVRKTVCVYERVRVFLGQCACPCTLCENMTVCVCVRESTSVCETVFVCVCERECVSVRDSACVCVKECVSV